MLKTCLNCGAEYEGSPQSRFHSNACRVAYSRREVAHDETPKEELAHSVRVPEPEPAQQEQPRRTRTPAISEEEYVREMMKLPPLKDDRDHRERQERYARWRYQGYCAGEVASL